jgi:hypothetical protein
MPEFKFLVSGLSDNIDKEWYEQPTRHTIPASNGSARVKPYIDKPGTVRATDSSSSQLQVEH